MTNAYLIGEGDDCVLIDAPLGVTDWLAEEGELPKEVLLTHQHYDHVEDAARLAAKGVRIRAYSDYSKELTLETHKAQWGFPIEVPPYTVDDVLGNTNALRSSGYDFRVEHVPGHSTDSIVFITTDKQSSDDTVFVFAGDTLFADGIGRPDLPGGDAELLIEGIRSKLLNLPSSSQVFPGHGFDTTIGRELAGNPYL